MKDDDDDGDVSARCLRCGQLVSAHRDGRCADGGLLTTKKDTNET